jgi:3',5'-cyclic-nucleotide phosphodiesterase
MDYAACNIVYVTRSAGEDRLVLRKDVINAVEQPGAPLPEDYFPLGKNESDNVKTLLEAFSEGEIASHSGRQTGTDLK